MIGTSFENSQDTTANIKNKGQENFETVTGSQTEKTTRQFGDSADTITGEYTNLVIENYQPFWGKHFFLLVVKFNIYFVVICALILQELAVQVTTLLSNPGEI